MTWHLSKGSPSRFEEVLNWASFNDCLSLNFRRLQFPTVQAVLDGRILPESAVTEPDPESQTGGRRLSSDQIRIISKKGATLVFRDIYLWNSQVRGLVQEVCRELSETVKANLYYSPGGIPGYEIHYDTHDVLVLQLEGDKHWEFYGVTYPLPLSTQPSKNRAKPSSKIAEANLRKGDTLYVPRGLWHSARASVGSPSLHLTIGLYRRTRMDMLRWFIDRFADDMELRADAASPFDPQAVEKSLELISDKLRDSLINRRSLAKQYQDYSEFVIEKQNEVFEFPY
jgi:ribosomal protein L16 Arg81 hydroxylase